MFFAFTRGYLSKVKETISQIELEHLIDGAITMTYECGLRFLSDYLNGNKYFKPKEGQPEDINLRRGLTQLKLAQDMIKKEIKNGY